MRNLCIIFDLDGTLVDSERLCNQAFLDLIPDLNCTLDELVQRYRGVKLALIFQGIEQSIGHPLPADFETPYRARVAELVDSELQTIPGVHQMLDTLKYPKCIASSGPLKKIRKSLSVSGLAPFFGENLFSSYEVQSWKPEPGLFLHAAQAMGFPPSACVVVEDSPPGIQAAQAAGMHPFLYDPNHESPPISGVTHFSNMTELPTLLANLTTR